MGIQRRTGLSRALKSPTQDWLEEDTPALSKLKSAPPPRQRAATATFISFVFPIRRVVTTTNRPQQELSSATMISDCTHNLRARPRWHGGPTKRCRLHERPSKAPWQRPSRTLLQRLLASCGSSENLKAQNPPARGQIRWSNSTRLSRTQPRRFRRASGSADDLAPPTSADFVNSSSLLSGELEVGDLQGSEIR